MSAAISSGWSNGQTKGQIYELKLLKHQVNGRGNSICSKRTSSARRELTQSSSNMRQSPFRMPITPRPGLYSMPIHIVDTDIALRSTEWRIIE